MVISINYLPLEIIKLIFLELDSKSYLRVGQVCQQWRELTRRSFTLRQHIKDVLLSPGECSRVFRAWEGLVMDSENQNQLAINTSSKSGNYSPVYKLSPGSFNRQNEIALTNTSFDKDKELEKIYFQLLGMKFVSHNFSLSYIVTTHSPPLQKTKLRNVEHKAFSPDGTRYIVSYYYKPPNNEKDHGYGAYKRFYIYDISNRDVKLVNLFTHICDRAITDISISCDNLFMAISYSPGYVEVLKIPSASTESEIDPDTELSYSTRHRIFSRQYPSAINYLSVSNNGELLFIRSQRLGGLLLVNLDTQEEMDIPHYRLDLRMHLQNKDEVLALSGWNETIVYGHFNSTKKSLGSTNISDTTEIQPRVLWKYYQDMISCHYFMYLHADFAVALGTKGVFLGFRFEEDEINVFLIEENISIDGFRSLEEFIEEEKSYEETCQSKNRITSLKRKHSQDNIEVRNDYGMSSSRTLIEPSQIPESHITEADPASIELRQFNLPYYTETILEGQSSIASPRQDPEDQNDQEEQEQNQEEDEDDSDYDEDENESDDSPTREVLLLKVHETDSHKDIKYALTLDGSRLAIASHDKKLHIFSLNNEAIKYAFENNELPSRTLLIDVFDDDCVHNLQFVGRDKLKVSFHTATSIVFDFTSDITDRNQVVRWELIEGRLDKNIDPGDKNDYDPDENHRRDNKKQPATLLELSLWCRSQSLSYNN
ncbi:hypothetical protein NADFUDRAFT_84444 [Nadsonia fulvescens var. elongata DSM 6958]|uniref:F-box domain-containing protein n=1 Tax=Nadsonia fulvescens var. elongata DSM 6958 TaxID=857566 RepID=A0A1E3PDB5_9ASCO|nr:hypothetical protein NADFUDRAFT_84444 [Nadsonia fulvescens var. elongata DSM 6958]